MNYKCDVLVIGGGMSGISAAVSAAKKGLRVILAEQLSLLGGMGTAGLITMVMTSRYHFYGFGRRLMEELCRKGDARKIEKPAIAGYDYYPFDAEAMKRALDDVLIQNGVTLLLGTKLISAHCENARVTSATLFGPAGALEVRAKVLIDASGDAALCEAAGEEILYGDENGNIQAPTMLAYYAGIDFDRYEAFLATFEDGKRAAKINMIHTLVPLAVKEGVISEADLHHPGIFRINEHESIGVMNAGHVYGADVSTAEGFTEATVRGRRMAKEYLDFYRRYVPGFENAYMTNTGSVLALREGKRVVGRYTMCFDEKAEYKKFDDAVMRMDGGAVSDLHASSSDKKAYEAYRTLFADREKVRADDFATLPYRSLLAKKNDNLLVCGRCASADRKVMGQIRIMGYCFMMGEAAGLAAAIACRNGCDPSTIDVGTLQRELLENQIPTL